MKVYLSADIEGVTGVTHWDETNLEKSESAAAREQMTAEVAAACEGALQAGASEVWVQDAHWTGRNLAAGKLPRQTRLIRGWSGHPLQMVQLLDSSFGALLFIGYHSRAAANTNPLSHSMSGDVTRIVINDRPVSEFLIHGYAAATMGVPVAFLSGDQGLCREVTEVNARIATLAVKEGIGEATVSMHPAAAVERIREGVKAALAGDLAVCLVPPPARLAVDVEYRAHTKAFRSAFYPGARQSDALTVRFESDSYLEVMRFLLFTV